MVETFEPRTNFRNREAMICPIFADFKTHCISVRAGCARSLYSRELT